MPQKAQGDWAAAIIPAEWCERWFVPQLPNSQLTHLHLLHRQRLTFCNDHVSSHLAAQKLQTPGGISLLAVSLAEKAFHYSAATHCLWLSTL